MNTHTDFTYDTKEQARQAMHRFLKGKIDDEQHQIGNKDGECHRVLAKTEQLMRANGQKDKKRTSFITERLGKFMIRVEN